MRRASNGPQVSRWSLPYCIPGCHGGVRSTSLPKGLGSKGSGSGSRGGSCVARAEGLEVKLDTNGQNDGDRSHKVVAPRTPDRFCTALISTTPLSTTPHNPSCRVSSLVLFSLLCDLSIHPIKPFSSRRDRRRTRPAVIAQPDCDIRSSSRSSKPTPATPPLFFFPATPHRDKEIN